MTKKVAIIQSNYVPWKGYFDIINDVDEFIFLDDVQFTKQDWRSRNYIQTQNGLKFISVPCGSDIKRLINEVKITDDKWGQKHWNQITEAYKKAPYFQKYKSFFEEVYLSKKWEYLSHLNQFLIKSIAVDLLGINTIFTNSTDYAGNGNKGEKVMSLIKLSLASCYLSGPAAKSYIEPEEYQKEGIELQWKDYTGYPEYKQINQYFEHGVSIIDLLFNTGDDAPYYIWGWRNV